jgi:hypothetical protein
VLRHCGVPLERAPNFGLALGRAALNDQASAKANDVCEGDTLTLFERAAEVLRRESELANMN